MKSYHLYKINGKYVYILQVTNDKNSMDVLAIRSDIPHVIFPMYSPTLKDYEDLGIPSADLLKEIDIYFFSAIRATQTLCYGVFNRSSNGLRDFIKQYIIDTSSLSNNDNIRATATMSMSINRSNCIEIEGLKKYVKDKQHAAGINTDN